MAALSAGGVVARARAVPGRPRLRWHAEEGQAAVSAGVLRKTPARPVGSDDERFVVADAPVTCGVATLTRRDQVLGPVVELVPVHVVDDQHPGVAGPDESDRPMEGPAAPVAPVLPGTDLLVEDHPVLGDVAASACERMVGSPQVPSRCRLGLRQARIRARGRAEHPLLHLGRRPRHGFAAVLARSGDRHFVDLSRTEQ